MWAQYVWFIGNTLPVANRPREGARTVFKMLAIKLVKLYSLNST